MPIFNLSVSLKNLVQLKNKYGIKISIIKTIKNKPKLISKLNILFAKFLSEFFL